MADTKHDIRARIIAKRRARANASGASNVGVVAGKNAASPVQNSVGAPWTERVLELTAGAKTVASYCSTASEPDTSPLHFAWQTRGVKVLLPVLRREPDWAWFAGEGALALGPHGIPAPIGQPLGADSLAQAEWIIIPGLAGTVAGVRLGTGGGWYDRALPHARGQAPRVLALFDDEVVESLPADSWDLPVDYLITD
ncbi:MAG: 5-formyltetrahydrofolate cyclo-ligase, partial [Propionibacteriaceae bacterium]|nr:5-formyltetrahydrofolate cyclo-ligase [Propionibacteriaceae bacterium]